MSVTVPYGPVQYQSHHHCQCDFCNSRRTVEAKKRGVDTAVTQLHSSQQQKNTYPSHAAASGKLGAQNGVASFELDDPEHHVNQTELNAKMGRTGLPEGNKYTIATGGTRGARSAGVVVPAKPKTKEEQEAEAMEDLDRLERLLILEHKARVKATADAERLALLESTGKGPRPQPFEAPSPSLTEEIQKKVRKGASLYQPGTIREAYENACRCSVTPPPHCEASHLLQHTMDDLRDVARDPINKKNPEKLQNILQIQGAQGATPKSLSPGQADADANGVGDSTAKKWRDYLAPRPEGAGVVWRKIKPSIPEDTTTACGGLGNVDKRHLWKSTVVKGASGAKHPTANGTDATKVVTVTDPPLTSPGALASLAIQEQEKECQAKHASISPIPMARGEDERLE
ncbi:hypothetical protein TraAM80_01017 [Trypanosoma rangeli]|uniref:Uncharacterized protein n=1 Tax=Trypanosoma rangeli TaxID=5698 RepID=A0A3R7RRK4_TRYRA|nr:uncharacterized protein TraAM80_01017 [Trypanosoma rangeli]RNF11400.1 hypothetical protein TraAM80_01017 [Trypanosoma rangeli]|eukprot:RNF11400.1 hypothetical protein TraAM80_01017 [Trypanosoma rangeli]